MTLMDQLNKYRLPLAVIGLIVFLAIPFVITDKLLIHLAILGMFYAIVASNWDLTLGYAGVFNFAHLAFFGIGGYTSGILAVKLGISPWLGIPAGGAVAAVASVIVSIPAIRLRGIYVALLTFACSQLVLLLLLSQPLITGGQSGLVGVPQLSIGDFNFRESKFAHFYLVGILAALLDPILAPAGHVRFRPELDRPARLRRVRCRPWYPAGAATPAGLPVQLDFSRLGWGGSTRIF